MVLSMNSPSRKADDFCWHVIFNPTRIKDGPNFKAVVTSASCQLSNLHIIYTNFTMNESEKCDIDWSVLEYLLYWFYNQKCSIICFLLFLVAKNVSQYQKSWAVHEIFFFLFFFYFCLFIFKWKMCLIKWNGLFIAHNTD